MNGAYLTGDTHGSFERISAFCEQNETSKEDLLIILGDAGINYYGMVRDAYKKEYLAALPITILAIHGNHEQRPYTLPDYKEAEWHGGIVYMEEKYPSLLFAKDGEIYDINGKKTLVIGGAYSVDKYIRQMRAARFGGQEWWPDEQPSEEIKAYVESQLEKAEWKVDVVLTHTAPLKYEPVEDFIPGLDQSGIDKSTEEWLDQIEDRLDYDWWFCGHYHTCRQKGKIRFMFEDYAEFPG